MRVFIAIDLPEQVKAELQSAQKQLSSAPAKMSMAHDFHLTLKFIGEITPAQVEALKKCLSTVKFKPFTASLGRVGAFPNYDYAKVVWIGLEPEDGMIELQQVIDDALEKEFHRDKGFKPHLTLARVKGVNDKKGFAHQLVRTKYEKASFTVDCFKLKSSTLGSTGAVYEDVGTYSQA